MRVFSVIGFVLTICVGSVWAEVKQHPIQAALDNGRIDEAEVLVQKIPDHQAQGLERDQWLGKLALAQLQHGDSDGAKDSLRRIYSTGELTRAATAVAQEARGGATGADFQSLIDLITTTVEPDSWDDVGGPGTVQEFPGGVAVNAQGVVSKAKPRKQSRTLDVIRETSRDPHANLDVRKSSKLRMVSLPRLERELMIRQVMGETPTEAMTHLAGLFEIQYVFVYPESNDVIIAGPAASWRDDENGRAVTATGRPVLLLDDLVCLLQNAQRHQGKFGCSIDPKRENLAATKAFLARPTGTLKPSQTRRWVNQIRKTLGLQNIHVYGIDAGSHAAHVIVEADYHMKLVGMGLEPSVDRLESYLDSIDRHSIPQSMDVLRWWFTLKPDGLVRNQDGTAFEFAAQVVRLQCENEQLSRDGTRSRTGSSSELNQQFAHQFTQQFDQLRRRYPLYAQLDNIFRMALVAGLIQSSQVNAQVDWRADWFVKAVRPVLAVAPAEVESIVNHRVIDRRHVVVGVSGGVTLNVAHYVRDLKTTQQDSLDALGQGIGQRTLVSRDPTLVVGLVAIN